MKRQGLFIYHWIDVFYDEVTRQLWPVYFDKSIQEVYGCVCLLEKKLCVRT